MFGKEFLNKKKLQHNQSSLFSDSHDDQCSSPVSISSAAEQEEL